MSTRKATGGRIPKQKRRYILVKDESRGRRFWTIRYSEVVDGKKSLKRLPRDQYKKHEHDLEYLQSLVLRLNGRDQKAEEAKALWEQASVFINMKLKIAFQQFVIDELSSEEEGKKYFNYFERYSLPFLVSKSPDPLEWPKYQRAWKQHLLGLGKSNNVLKRIVRVTNLYFEYLSFEFPDEVEAFIFKPFKKSDYKNNDAKRSDKREAKYISSSDWKVIEKNLPEELRSITIISKNYGLRLAEALGLYGRVEEILYEQCLTINCQLKNIKPTITFKPTKTRDTRDIKHYFLKASEIYDLIDEINLLSTWSASRKFSVFCNDLYEKGRIKNDYTFHDLRHTFITDIASSHGAYEAQIAAGHARLSTTDGYVHKKEKVEKTKYVRAA